MRPSVRIAASILAVLLASAPALAQMDRAAVQPVASSPVRHVLVKAVGQGRTSEEAEHSALKKARALAVARFAHLGGAAALDPDPGHVRILAAHHSPPMGFAEIRATVLVELRLRPVAETAPGNSQPLPVLTVRLEGGSVVVEGTPAMETILVLEHADGQEPDLLPGGGGGSWRLVPGRPLRQPVPPARQGSRLHVLACTGGLNAPASAENAGEALLRARAGKPRPVVSQGVVSECVERVLRLGPPKATAPLSRSLEPEQAGQFGQGN